MATRLMPAAAAGDAGVYRWAAFGTGFLLQFNLVPAAWHIPVTRISLIAMLPWIAFLIHRLLSRANPLSTILYSAIIVLFVFLHLAFSGTALTFGGGNVDLALSLGYLIYLLGAVGLYIVLAQRSGTAWFCWGLLFGALTSLLVFVMQAIGLGGLAISLGLSQPRQVIQGLVDGSSRLTGMWGHANEVGHILAISAPAAGYLFVSRRDRAPLVLLAIIMGGCFFFTANRGGMIAAIITCIAMFFARKESVMEQRRPLLITLALLAVVGYALYFLPAPEFIFARFTEDSNINNNASGRLGTTLAGLEMAVTHPFGMSGVDWRSALRSRTGFSTPHNGFIAMTNSIGLPFVLMYLVALVTVVLAGLRKPRKLSLDIFLMLAAVQASFSFMFEDVSLADPFMVIIGLIMARVYSGAVTLAAPRRRNASAGRRQADAQAATQDPLDQAT
ncbi:O-antigen ligase [Sphingomonas sp.]|uniref:O-antigen ligase family protein n=1 Tax=Sphingomonas sp. TaxID=28214 RepID=UPI000DB4FD46|nr:O-antigen ligase family protein [Sphingomonas sp.]PZU07037.1 MAG: hypothetical protein DI605_16920 [Sphingomonas sp.]